MHANHWGLVALLIEFKIKVLQEVVLYSVPPLITYECQHAIKLMP